MKFYTEFGKIAYVSGVLKTLIIQSKDEKTQNIILKDIGTILEDILNTIDN